MSVKNYKGNPNKGIWENSRFTKGMRYTNEPMREGSVKALANLDISRTGASLRPRLPYFSTAFRTHGAPFGLGKYTIQFQTKQDLTKNYFLDIGNIPVDNKWVSPSDKNIGAMITAGEITVIDGDTIDICGKRYRLLLIDSPEFGESYYNEAKQALEGIINDVGFNEEHLYVVYDRYNNSHVDSPTRDFDQRDLVWLFIEETNINKLLYDTGYYKLYGDSKDLEKTPLIIPNYDLLDPDLLVSKRDEHILGQVGVYEGFNTTNTKPLSFRRAFKGISMYEEYTTNGVDVYRQNDGYIKTPVKNIEQTTNISLDKMYEDLKLQPGTPVNIQINVQEHSKNYNTHIFTNRSLPYIDYTSDTHDGIIFLGSVLDSSNIELYKGMMSINYVVPLDKETETYPQFDKGYFEVATFDEDIFEIKLEQVDRFAINMLAKKPPEIISQYGQDALDAKYPYPKLKSVLLSNVLNPGKYIKTVKYGEYYTINPIVALPTLSIENGYEGYEGYAIRYDIYNVDRNSNPSSDPMVSTHWTRMTSTPNVDGIPPTKVWVEVARGYNSNGDKTYLGNKYDTLPDEKKVRRTTIYGVATPSWWGNKYIYNISNSEVDPLHSSGSAKASDNPVGTLMKTLYNDYVENPEDREIIYECRYICNTLKTNDGILFKDSPNGIYVNVFVVPIEEFMTDHIMLPKEYGNLDSYAFIHNTGVFLYGDREEQLNLYSHGEELYTAKNITVFDGRVLLYGCDKSKDVIYMSDTYNHLYFPLNYTLDQFDEPIVHVFPFNNSLIVFTTSDIYMVYNQPVVTVNEETKEETYTDLYLTKKIINNISIDTFHKDTVVAVNKFLLFVSNDNVYIMKPNIYVEDPTDIFLSTIGDPIAELFYNPTSYIARRHQYYGATGNIFSESFRPKIETKSFVNNNILSIFMSMNIPELDMVNDGLFMIEIIYDVERDLWKLYDTKSCGFPIGQMIVDTIEGPRYIMNNHDTVGGGSTLVMRSGFDLSRFDDGIGKILDIKSMKFINGQFVYNTALINSSQEILDKVKQPIHGYINSGNMYITPHLFKRFHQIVLDVTNIDCLAMPLSIDFAVDGHVRQNSRNLTMMQIADGNSGSVITTYQSTQMSDGISFDTWGLDVSRFGPLQTLKIKAPVSGRGRYASVEIGFKTSGMFEVFKYAVIYKEQTVR